MRLIWSQACENRGASMKLKRQIKKLGIARFFYDTQSARNSSEMNQVWCPKIMEKARLRDGPSIVKKWWSF